VVDPGAMFTPESQSQINLADIDPNPFQPRREFDEVELANLADSIREHGMLQPVAVRRVGDRYQLIAGERRLRAATMADWQTIPARVVEADDRQLVELAIVENLQRKDLNPLEKAASFQRYLEQYQCTQEELARRLQLDRSTIANLIRLLELPLGVQDALRSGSITQGHARALLPLGDESEQVGMCRRVVTEGMSVRAVEAAVQEALHSTEETPLGLVTEDGESKPAPRPRSEHLAALEQELRAQLGAKVEIKEGTKGRGKLVIHFSNHEEFERLRQQLAGFSMPLSQAG
jgi:ParB family chromosome partitioning protein